MVKRRRFISTTTEPHLTVSWPQRQCPYSNHWLIINSLIDPSLPLMSNRFSLILIVWFHFLPGAIALWFSVSCRCQFKVRDWSMWDNKTRGVKVVTKHKTTKVKQEVTNRWQTSDNSSKLGQLEAETQSGGNESRWGNNELDISLLFVMIICFAIIEPPCVLCMWSLTSKHWETRGMSFTSSHSSSICSSLYSCYWAWSYSQTKDPADINKVVCIVFCCIV